MGKSENQLSWLLALTAIAILVAGGTMLVLGGTAPPFIGHWLRQYAVLWGGLSTAVALVGVTLLFLANRQLVGGLGEREEQIRALVRTAVDGIITTDEAGRIESFNTAAERMFGCRAAEAAGSSITMLLLLPDSIAQSKGLIDFLSENNVLVGTVNEIEGIRKSGRRFPMELSVSQTDLPTGPLLTIICRDITERKETQEALRHAHAELEGRVEARTAELKRANTKLRKEIAERERLEQNRQKLLTDLREALDKLKILGGLIPICANCKKVRDDQGYWKQIESYVRDRSYAEFSHSICPDCVEKLYPEFSEGDEEHEAEKAG